MSTDNNVENIRKYFTDKEWQDLSVTKKLHYANLKANYDIMVKLGDANTAAHERTHIGQKPFVCYVCQKGFSQSSSLGQHINIHGQIKPYVCADCGRGFNASSNLARHRKLHSNAMEAHTCSLCYKSFSRKDNLKRHLLCHAAREWRSRL
ncbi:hypothetical protein HPB49_025342 [Dermacentor silvarum]|uniref:Uncharacterized protein n=1 Tax=Dermacentor silvarum TaxID=543639 RepID=A0ACB8CNI1_DERSI|nr:hypothetical protein HPB49_025342 [Dermacentor silvarum]